MASIFFVNDHESLFEKIFPEDPPEGLDRFELEELNPEEAVMVAEFETEVYNWTCWAVRHYFYVYPVPDETACYLLFTIDYDDNWGVWDSNSLGAVRGPASGYEAAKLLLQQYAKENIDTEGEDEWNAFLNKLMTEDCERLQ